MNLRVGVHFVIVCNLSSFTSKDMQAGTEQEFGIVCRPSLVLLLWYGTVAILMQTIQLYERHELESLQNAPARNVNWERRLLILLSPLQILQGAPFPRTIFTINYYSYIV
jgi:hypothetical protein